MKQEWQLDGEEPTIEREDEIVREWDFAKVALSIIDHDVMMPFGKIEWDNSGENGHFAHRIIPLDDGEES